MTRNLLFLCFCFFCVGGRDSEEAEEEELQDQHAIAVAVKTVTFVNCLLVGTQ